MVALIWKIKGEQGSSVKVVAIHSKEGQCSVICIPSNEGIKPSKIIKEWNCNMTMNICHYIKHSNKLGNFEITLVLWETLHSQVRHTEAIKAVKTVVMENFTVVNEIATCLDMDNTPHCSWCSAFQ